MRLIKVGDQVLNCDTITAVLLRLEQPDAKFDAMTTQVRVVFDGGLYIGFPADSAEGKALAWWFSEGQEPFIWIQPLDVVAIHAEALKLKV